MIEIKIKIKNRYSGLRIIGYYNVFTINGHLMTT